MNDKQKKLVHEAAQLIQFIWCETLDAGSDRTCAIFNTRWDLIRFTTNLLATNIKELVDCFNNHYLKSLEEKLPKRPTPASAFTQALPAALRDAQVIIDTKHEIPKEFQLVFSCLVHMRDDVLTWEEDCLPPIEIKCGDDETSLAGGPKPRSF